MTPRTWFSTAAAGFVTVTENITPDELDAPGLGEWDVRSLLGHATRAFLTIETYLQAAGVSVTVASARDYYIASREVLADPVAVTQRGRAAGVALGEWPVSAAVQTAQRVLAIVSDAPDDAVVGTPVGGMRLIDYLPTRAFELTVHSMDLAAATDQPIGEDLLGASAPALDLAAQIASPEQRAALLLAVTGRARLDPGFSVL